MKHQKQRLKILLLIVLYGFTIGISGCASGEQYTAKAEGMNQYILQSSGSGPQIRDGFFFEMLAYKKQSLYLHDGYSLSRWQFSDGAFACTQIINLSDLFPNEYKDIDHTIEFIKNFEMIVVSFDGSFIAILNLRENDNFYLWSTQENTLHKITPSRPIKQLRWLESNTIWILDEENQIYTYDPKYKRINTEPLKPQMPNLDWQQTYPQENGVIFHDGGKLVLINGALQEQILDGIKECYGTYKDIVVVKRSDDTIEAARIDEVWAPFFSEALSYCFPVNGRYLHYNPAANQEIPLLLLLDLESGNKYAFTNPGQGYDIFPHIPAVLYFDSSGAPYVQHAGDR